MVSAMAEPTSPIRLNAACGLAYRTGYINFDLHPGGSRVDLAADLLALPFPRGAADQVVLSHVLEHLGRHETLPALLEARCALRLRGTIALEVPDLESCLSLWLNTPDPHRWGFPLDAIYGDQTHAGQFHKTGFTRSRLVELIERAGFFVEQASGGTSHGVDVIRVLARRPPAFQSRSDLESSLPLEDDRGLGRGWWPLERGGSGDFRWTAGKAVACLRVPDSESRRLRVAGHAALENVPGGKLSLRVSCDWQQVVEIEIERSGPITFTEELPTSCADEEFHRVELTVTPAFHVPGDERYLGIIVNELSLGQ